jgi:transcriptional regulator with XRE-family HTH domain
MLLIGCRLIVIKIVRLYHMQDSKSNHKARMIFSNNIRRIRKEKNLSQEDLAGLSGLHRTYVGSVERLERNISIDNMERLANALGVKLSTLLTEQNVPTPRSSET